MGKPEKGNVVTCFCIEVGGGHTLAGLLGGFRKVIYFPPKFDICKPLSLDARTIVYLRFTKRMK